MNNRSTDPWLITVVALLMVVGLVMVYSASAVVAAERTSDAMYFFKRQIFAVVLGLPLAVGAALTPMSLWRRFGKLFYGLCAVGLVLCFVPGLQHRANGAARWLGLGPLHLQPSEFAKIAVLIVLADFLDKNRGRMSEPATLVRAALVPLPAMVLILPEPDFGSTAITAGLCTIMLFVAGMRFAHMAVVGGIGALVGVPVMLAEQYRVQRLTSFLDPWASLEGDGYHVIQSWIAMHSGGLWGQGLGNSVAKLHFLPEPWTDFIAAVTAEELGLAGIFVLLCLYSAFVWRGLAIARRARDPFGMLLASCLTIGIGVQAFFNMAVVMGMVPPKGLVLPFMSYGASALMAHLLCVGLLLSVASEAREVPLASGWAEAEPPAPAPVIRVEPARGTA